MSVDEARTQAMGILRLCRQGATPGSQSPAQVSLTEMGESGAILVARQMPVVLTKEQRRLSVTRLAQSEDMQRTRDPRQAGAGQPRHAPEI